ncbi:MAG: amidohydrolase [Planctomycetes bacterium]|nr:amidohydrolase [Planctomycetota bacterium]
MTNAISRVFCATLFALIGAAAAQAQSTSTLFHNGRIVLHDVKGSVVDALLVSNGSVVAAGTYAALSVRPDARNAVLEDLQGATAVPGLQDAHGSLAGLASSFDTLDLSGTTSYADLIARVVERAAQQKEGTWIRGRGWNQNNWSTPEYPHHFLLSTAVPKHLVYLERVDGNVALVNSAALEAAKLGGQLEPAPKIKGGRVVLDESKRATGILLDTACRTVERLIPDPDAPTRVRQFMAAQALLLENGVTCVHDMGTSRSTLALLEELRRTQKLMLRVVAYIDGREELKAETLAGLPKPPDPLDMLSVPGVYLVIDGALDSYGAALLDDYSDAKNERGRLLLTEDELSVRLALVARAGLQPAVRAVGDRANRMALDAFARMAVAVPGFRELRPRVEQALVVAPKDWPRFPELGVIPSMQPAHAAADLSWVPERLGAERARGAYAWRALAPELGRLAFGSDFPHETPDPLRGLFAARTRRTLDLSDQPVVLDQRLEGAAALSGFTSGAAFAVFQDDRRGRLEPGFACDMTVLSVDPTSAAPDEILKATVRATVINGVVVWRAR